MKKGVDKNGSYISNGYRDIDSYRIALTKLFKREGFKDIDLLNYKIENIEGSYLEDIINEYGGITFPKPIPRMPLKSRVKEFVLFFNYWDNLKPMTEIKIIVKGEQLTFTDHYLLELVQKSISEYKKKIILDAHPIPVLIGGGKREKVFTEGVEINPFRSEAHQELGATIKFSRKIHSLRSTIKRVVKMSSKSFNSQRSINILTYKVLLALELLPNVSEDAMNAFINKHKRESVINQPPPPWNDINVTPTLEMVNSYLKQYYNQLFNI